MSSKGDGFSANNSATSAAAGRIWFVAKRSDGMARCSASDGWMNRQWTGKQMASGFVPGWPQNVCVDGVQNRQRSGTAATSMKVTMVVILSLQLPVRR